MQPGIVTLLRDFGLGPALSISVFLLMVWLVKRIMKDHLEERKSYQVIISNHMSSTTVAMKKLTDEIGNQSSVQQEANRYVRDEHREILKALMKINGKE